MKEYSDIIIPKNFMQNDADDGSQNYLNLTDRLPDISQDCTPLMRFIDFQKGHWPIALLEFGSTKGLLINTTSRNPKLSYQCSNRRLAIWCELWVYVNIH